MWCCKLRAYQCVSVCLCIRLELENASSWIWLDRFSWYLYTMIIKWKDNRGVQEFGVKGHLWVIWSCCLNILKMLLRLHNSILMKLGWRDPWPEVLLGCSGIFDQGSSWGHLGSLLKGKILNGLLQQNWLCQCAGLGQTSKSVNGDLFIWPVVKGSKVRKVQIWFYVGSNVELLNITHKKTYITNVLVLVNSHKVFRVTSSFDLWLRVKGQYAMNAHSVYIIQWILMQLVQSDSCIALMWMSRISS